MTDNSNGPNDPDAAAKVADLVARFHEGENLQNILRVEGEFVTRAERKAHEMYEAGRLEDAETLARGLLALDDERFFPNLLLGEILLKRDAPEEAREVLSVAHEADPEHALAAVKLAEAELALDEDASARRRLREVLESDPDDAQAYERASHLLDKNPGDDDT